MTTLTLWIIADALMAAGVVILIFCPIYEGQPSLWERFKDWWNR
jgi:hypothetical protein